MRSFLCICTGLFLLASMGCSGAPAIVEFMQMDPNEADLLDDGVRYKIALEIIQILNNPNGEHNIRPVEVFFQGQDFDMKESDPTLFEFNLGAPINNRAIMHSEELIGLESLFNSAQTSSDSNGVELHFDFDSDWGTDAIEGLNGYSELELLQLKIESIRVYLQTVITRFTKVEEIVSKVVRVEGTPFLLAYDVPRSELIVNPNFLRILSILPSSALTQLEGSTIAGECFDTCMALAQEAFVEDWEQYTEEACGGNFLCTLGLYIAGAVVYLIIIYPASALQCFQECGSCGIFAGSGAGALLIALTVFLPLAVVKLVGLRKRN